MRSLLQTVGQVGAGMMNDEMLPLLPEEIAGHVIHLSLVRQEGGRSRFAIAAGQLFPGESLHPIRSRSTMKRIKGTGRLNGLSSLPSPGFGAT